MWNLYTRKQVIRDKTSNLSLKTRGVATPALELLVHLRFIRTFAEVITFGEVSAHKFQPNFKLLAFEIGHLVIVQYKSI